MTAETIIEGNKLIAEFMGVKDGQISVSKTRTIFSGPENGIEVFAFHKSWDQLMPVVERIEMMGCIVEISMCLGRMCRIRKVISNSQDWQAVHESNSSIEAVYLPVVEFIKWHNQNKA